MNTERDGRTLMESQAYSGIAISQTPSIEYPTTDMVQ